MIEYDPSDEEDFFCCPCGCCCDEEVTEGSCIFCGSDDCCGCGACDDDRLVCMCDEPSTAAVTFPMLKPGTTLTYRGF